VENSGHVNCPWISLQLRWHLYRAQSTEAATLKRIRPLRAKAEPQDGTYRRSKTDMQDPTQI
jgi:hypothetical protein